MKAMHSWGFSYVIRVKNVTKVRTWVTIEMETNAYLYLKREFATNEDDFSSNPK